MSLQSRLGCWWIRLTMKRKPPGEAALIDFTRRRFRTPDWMIAVHSLGVNLRPVDGEVNGEWISPRTNHGASDRMIYYLHGGGYISGSAKSARPITATLVRNFGVRAF